MSYQKTELGNLTPSSWTGCHTQLFFIWWQLQQTNQWCCNENENGPSYANLFVGFIENKFFSNYHRPKPDLYKCYIHDCVCATSSSKEELNQFIDSVNSLHPALKYTWEISENSLAFLDIKLFISFGHREYWMKGPIGRRKKIECLCKLQTPGKNSITNLCFVKTIFINCVTLHSQSISL